MQQAPNGWAGARRIVYAQAGKWYETNKEDRTEDHLPDLRRVALSAWLLGVALIAPVAGQMVPTCLVI